MNSRRTVQPERRRTLTMAKQGAFKHPIPDEVFIPSWQGGKSFGQPAYFRLAAFSICGTLVYRTLTDFIPLVDWESSPFQTTPTTSEQSSHNELVVGTKIQSSHPFNPSASFVSSQRSLVGPKPRFHVGNRYVRTPTFLNDKHNLIW